MTVQTFWDSQLTGEVKDYTVDVSEWLADGVTVVSGSASYTQTYGGSAAGSAPVSVASPYATLTTPALTTVGRYEFKALLTQSDSRVRAVLWKIAVDK